MPQRQRHFCGCGEEILFSRRATCRRCRDNATKQQRDTKRRERAEAIVVAAKSIDKVVLHSCLGNMFDAAQPCSCRKLVSFEDGLAYVKSGRCVDFETRQPIFADRAILEANLFKQTPRGATIERAHIERALLKGLQRFKDQQPSKTPEELQKQFRELQCRIEMDKLARAEEEKYRWDVFNELNKQFRAEITIMVPAEIYDDAKRRARGIPALQTIVADRRTCVGLNISAPIKAYDDDGTDNVAIAVASNISDDQIATQKENIMTAHRLVPKENALDKASAETFVTIESGGAAVPTGETIEITGGWKVNVYSTDGMAIPPAAAGRSNFGVISVNPQGVARLRDSVGFEFDVPSTLPEFLGDVVNLQAGQRISAVVFGQSDLRDVVVENGLCERKAYDGAVAPHDLSWTPGTATGHGFVKS